MALDKLIAPRHANYCTVVPRIQTFMVRSSLSGHWRGKFSKRDCGDGCGAGGPAQEIDKSGQERVQDSGLAGHFRVLQTAPVSTTSPA